MHKMLCSIEQNATIGGGGQNDPLLGRRGCQKSLGIEGLGLLMFVAYFFHREDEKNGRGGGTASIVVQTYHNGLGA